MFVGVFLIMAFAPDSSSTTATRTSSTSTIPEGSVLRPQFPAPLGNRLSADGAPVRRGRRRLLEGARPQFAVSGSYGTSPNFVYSGTDTPGRDPYQILEILYGGIPARPVGDGLDGHSWWPLFKAVPDRVPGEVLPAARRVLQGAARTPAAPATTAAATAWPRSTRFLEDGLITFQDDRAQTFPWGVSGGRHGEPLAEDADPRRRRGDGACRRRWRTCPCTRATS